MSEQSRRGHANAARPTRAVEQTSSGVAGDQPDEYSLDAQSCGYDPYNCTRTPRVIDAWKGKSKRS